LTEAIELDAKDLHRPCDPSRFAFETSDDLTPSKEILGQPRAAAAAEFGVGIGRDGYNLFVMGAPGTGRRHLARDFVTQRSAEATTPPDWCYVHNFDDPKRPQALRVSTGIGNRFRRDMEQLVDELHSALTTALESEEYQTQRQMLDAEVEERQAAILEEVRKDAESRGIRLIQGPGGILFAPVQGNKLIPPQDVERLPAEERQRLEKEVELLQIEIQKRLRQAPRWHRERREKIRALNQQVTRFAVGSLIEERKNEYGEEPEICTYLDRVERDLVENAPALIHQVGQGGPQPFQLMLQAVETQDGFLRRYRVNVVVDNGETTGAPVIEEDHPTYPNLLGRLEHRAQFGALVTDFDLIRAGALHRANGGYLLLDALEVLRHPLAWDGLKRAARTGQIRISSVSESLGWTQPVSLEPDPIPLQVKLVLLGEPWIYHLLYERDPDFANLFKVAVELDDRIERSPDLERNYATFITGLLRDDGLRPFDRLAVARLVEEATRVTSDAERLTLNVEQLRDLLRESDYWAERAGAAVASHDHVDQAIAQRVYRSDRLRERTQEAIARGTLEVATEGTAVGQINGLSVIELGGFRFGRPTRITARVRVGSGEVVDIEREVELSGPLHSKGVLILSGYLGQRYAPETPLSLSASLVFEQSYSGVEGDSASLAELYALLSAIAGVPLRQDLAITGSVNQHGGVQAIGGVNEKIEAFFDLCRARTLSGRQGVMIPRSNIIHLMLRSDVVDAVRNGQFHVYAIDSVDAGLEVLSGLAAGEANSAGEFSEGSFNERVRKRLAALAESRQAFSRPPEDPRS